MEEPRPEPEGSGPGRLLPVRVEARARIAGGCCATPAARSGLGPAIRIEAAPCLAPEMAPGIPEAGQESDLYGSFGRCSPRERRAGLWESNRRESENGEQCEGREGAAWDGTAHGTLLPRWLRPPAAMAASEPTGSRV